MNYKKIALAIFFNIQILSAMVYEDGWSIYDNSPEGATVSVVADDEIGKSVTQLSGSTMDNGYMLGSFNDLKSWNNSEDKILKWSMKYSEEFVIYIKLKTQKGDRYLYYTAHNQDYGRSEGSIYTHHGLGVSAKDGTWRTFSRDIEADLKEFENDNSLISVNAFLIRGSGYIYGVEMFSKNDKTIYESGDQGNQWYIYDNTPAGATDIAVWDGETHSNIMILNGSGTDNGYSLNGWNNSKNIFLSWKMEFDEEYVIFVKLNTKNGVRYLYYTASNESYGGLEYIHHGLGVNSKDGTWREYRRNIEEDLKKFDSENELISVDSFLVRGSGKFDDIEMYSRVESSNKVLLLYDETVADAGNKVGKGNAILLENLLGHFNLDVTSKLVNQYQSTDIVGKRAIFYLGTTFHALNQYPEGSASSEAYKSFYRDIAQRDKTVVWMNYNLDNFEQYWADNNLLNSTFENRYKFSFKDINSALKYNRVYYKNTELYKGVIPYATPGASIDGCILEEGKRYACSLELNRVNIVDANIVDVIATAGSTINNGNTPITPYIVNSKNFWFIGDIPLSFMSEEDRYLAFSDILHDMLNITHEESHKAIMRLEDVDARTEMADLNSIVSYMDSKNIIFSVATIPQYEDPLGIENNGVATTELLSNSIVGTRLKELYDAGKIKIVQHGTTHQYHKSLEDNVSEISNPYNGLTGDDFEFMRVIEHADLSYSYLYPEENDSAVWAKDRINSGKSIFNDIGLTAFSWEAPHYMAGPNHYRGIKEIYPIQYARVLYFPNEDSNDSALRNKFVGQFYPYMIYKDFYGYMIIPENIHNIEDEPNIGYRKILPADTIHFAKKLKVVRDGVASFFYHAYLGNGYLQQIVEGLEAEGYTFVSAPSLVE